MLDDLCEEHGITLSPRHLPSVLDCWADRLSRRRDSLHWELLDIVRRLLELSMQRKLRAVDGHDHPDHTPLPGPAGRLCSAPRRSRRRCYGEAALAAPELVQRRTTARTTRARAGSAGRVEPHGSLAERCVQLQCHASLRWSTEGQQAAAPLLGDILGSGQAAHLVGSNQAHSTQASNQTHWERFVRYCSLAGSAPLPSTPATVACYLGTLYASGCVRGGSIHPNSRPWAASIVAAASPT
jgi:hypothetical protein